MNDKASNSRGEANTSRLREALEWARAFIENGIETGHIRMPTAQDDPARKTLPLIKAALSTCPSPDGEAVEAARFIMEEADDYAEETVLVARAYLALAAPVAIEKRSG